MSGYDKTALRRLVFRKHPLQVLTLTASQIAQMFFEFPFFESYPNSSRFGVSGFMYRGYSVFFSVIFLIQNWNLNKIKSLIFLIPLIVSGTKMGILAIALFIFFVII